MNIGVAGEWAVGDAGARAEARSPSSVAGAITQFVWVDVDGDIDARFERAKAAGAHVVQEPADQFYGSRTYRVLDPEGHVWNFREQTRQVPREEMEQASGLTFEQ